MDLHVEFPSILVSPLSSDVHDLKAQLANKDPIEQAPSVQRWKRRARANGPISSTTILGRKPSTQPLELKGSPPPLPRRQFVQGIAKSITTTSPYEIVLDDSQPRQSQ